MNFSGSEIDFSALHRSVSAIRSELGRVIVGQEKVIDLLTCAILSNGHVLIEGVPGVAKTLVAKLLSRTLSVGFSRIQFTPDLMPSDVLGTSVLNMSTSQFEFKSGPIFSNFVLIDEINRSPAKTQAALFEVMEERQITIDGHCYPMEPPFLVFATQNPVEQEGTYRLPEAQLDRFLFKVVVDYPSPLEEAKIIAAHHAHRQPLETMPIEAVMSAEELIAFQALVRRVFIDEKLINYIAQVVCATRDNGSLFLGASPRASVAILNASKSLAAMRGRDFVNPDDIRYVAGPVLRHRIILTPEKEMEGITADQIMQQIMESIEIPR